MGHKFPGPYLTYPAGTESQGLRAAGFQVFASFSTRATSGNQNPPIMTPPLFPTGQYPAPMSHLHHTPTVIAPPPVCQLGMLVDVASGLRHSAHEHLLPA